MSNRHRTESGEFSEEVSDQDILKLFEEASAPFLTSGELADELPISRSAVNHRLKRMLDRGLVARKETGARSVGWWKVKREEITASAAAAPSVDEMSEIHFMDGEHDPNGSFFGGGPLEVEDGESIDVEDTDEILGDALADEWADK